MQISTAINIPKPNMIAGQVGPAAYGPGFITDFTSGNQSLDPRITFSRASNATVTNSAGLIQYAPHNLMLYSEQLDNSSWTKTRSTITSNTVVAPDGTTTADAIIEDSTATSTHFVRELVTGVSGVTYTISLFLKANTRTWALVTIAGGSGYYFDVGTGAVGSYFSGTGTVSNPFCTSVGNGWYRCGFTVVAGSTNNGIDVYLATGNNVVSYTGNGTSGLYIWGAQLNVGSLQSYNPTTVKNLLGFSEAFDNAAWNKYTAATITANSTIAPNGTNTADTMLETTAVAAAHRLQQAGTVTSGAPVTVSIYAKANGRTVFDLFDAFTSKGASFNLTTVTTSAPQTSGINAATSASITSVGNGWYRCSITVTTTSTSASLSILLSDGTTTVYTGDSSKGIFVWGAQLSDSASLDTYVNNPVAAPTAAAYYGPRFDYDPVTLQPKGLLIEEQRTNLALRSEEFNSATWGATNFTVLSDNIVSPDGTQDAEALIETTTASAFHYAQQTITKAASAIQYTASIYVKAKGRQIGMSIATGAGGAVGRFNPDTGVITLAAGAYGTWTAQSFTATAVGNGWYRCVLTGTSDTATSFAFQISTWNTALNTNVYTGDGVSGFYVWGAQVEAGAFATSYIPTVASQVTRSADIALIQGSNFSGWYNSSQGSFFTNTQIYSSFARNSAGFDIQDGSTTNNRIIYRQITTGSADQVVIRSGSTTVATLSSGAAASASVRKTALRYKLDDFAMTTNDTLPSTDTGGAVPVGVTQMLLGSALAGSEFLNGYIRQIAYYPRTLSDSELRAITA